AEDEGGDELSESAMGVEESTTTTTTRATRIHAICGFLGRGPTQGGTSSALPDMQHVEGGGATRRRRRDD
ncbi:MAG: hypothetical protein JXA57_19475, partial [Armatimonadetes bacterium]|nr:hypothetical protein [Armatimonadota bacterium]